MRVSLLTVELSPPVFCQIEGILPTSRAWCGNSTSLGSPYLLRVRHAFVRLSHSVYRAHISSSCSIWLTRRGELGYGWMILQQIPFSSVTHSYKRFHPGPRLSDFSKLKFMVSGMSTSAQSFLHLHLQHQCRVIGGIRRLFGMPSSFSYLAFPVIAIFTPKPIHLQYYHNGNAFSNLESELLQAEPHPAKLSAVVQRLLSGRNGPFGYQENKGISGARAPCLHMKTCACALQQLSEQAHCMRTAGFQGILGAGAPCSLHGLRAGDAGSLPGRASRVLYAELSALGQGNDIEQSQTWRECECHERGVDVAVSMLSTMVGSD
jgi:hypothetical protein